jgi:hypothetical protein
MFGIFHNTKRVSPHIHFHHPRGYPKTRPRKREQSDDSEPKPRTIRESYLSVNLDNLRTVLTRNFSRKQKFPILLSLFILSFCPPDTSSKTGHFTISFSSNCHTAYLQQPLTPPHSHISWAVRLRQQTCGLQFMPHHHETITLPARGISSSQNQARLYQSAACSICHIASSKLYT